MQSIELLRTTLERLSDPNHYIFSTSDFYGLFPTLSRQALHVLLSRATQKGILERACQGLYIYPKAHYERGYELYHLAARLRDNYFCYLSLESILSEAGVISQIPMGYITLMTNGRSGVINCHRFGKIEFIHTKKPLSTLRSDIYYNDRYQLWCANVLLAYRDMTATKRSLDLVDFEVLHELI